MAYNYTTHFYLTVVGVVLLIVLVFSLRSEIAFLSQHKNLRLQLFLSMLSIFVMLLLTLVTLFHWLLSPIYEFTAILALFPILLILAPLILWLRAKSFTALAKDRLEEQKRLIREVQELIDERKREKIKEGKASRGEPIEDDDPHNLPG
jgi:hypothetical protein